MNDRPGDGQNRDVTEPQRESATQTEGLFLYLLIFTFVFKVLASLYGFTSM